MAISYLYSGEPMVGTANDDFVIAFKGSTGTDNNTINGNGGDDLIISDSSDTWIPGANYLNGSIGVAFNLETLTSTWTTAENEMFGDWTTPHTTVICEATIGQSEFFRVAIGAGQQITIDIDFASNTAIGVTGDLVVELQDSLGNVIATADDSLVTQGGFGSNPSSPGSASSYDPYLTYTVASAGTYYINVRPFGTGPGSTFTANNTFLMNLSVTGHAVAATNPVQGNDIVHGGDDNDTIFGQGGDDNLSGDNGNDFISGGAGGDIISGGEGDDTISGGDGSEENAHGDNGNDTLISGGEGHYYGNAGDDTIFAGLTAGVNEILDGGDDIDTLDTTTWNGTYDINLVTGVTNFGESFINFENVKTGNGADTITGTSGDNVITTQGGIDTVNAGDGNDIVSGGAAGDTLNGEAGALDILNYRLSSGAVTINLATNTASGGDAAGDVISNFEGVYGSVLGDTLTGSTGDNALYGYEGNDTINGGNGADTLDGGVNDDIVNGGAGNDIVIMAGGGSDTLDGSFDKDFLDFRGNPGPVVVSLAAGTWNGSTFVNFEGVYGTGTDDTLTGDGNNNELDGFAGNDTLDGGGGNDTMVGSLGDDAYVVDSTTDIVTDLAGEGTDTVSSSANWTLGLETENLILTGSANLTGIGSNHANTITGNTGNNTLNGNKGDDTINGDAGIDTIDGGVGNDTIDGGAGNDVMMGGVGNDTYFVNSTSDTVTDLAGEGTDLVQSTVNWTLGAQTENLTLLGTGNTSGFGNDADNTIIGNKGANVLGGAGGNDTINGAGGADTIDGGAGDDLLDGGGGTDTMAGSAGNDTYFVDSSTDVVTDLGGDGIDTVRSLVDWHLGTQTENLLLISGNTTGEGNDNDNVITGSSGNNILIANGGNDTVIGGLGTDNIDGGNGDDTIDGGAGNDIVVGGAGADSIKAAAGNDTLIYNTGVSASQGPGYDTITSFDFKNGDKFDLDVAVSAIDAGVGAGLSLSQATFNTDMAAAIGAGQLAAHHALLFTPTAGDLAGSTFLIVDANGIAGFQGAGDYVFKLVTAAHIGSLNTVDFI